MAWSSSNDRLPSEWELLLVESAQEKQAVEEKMEKERADKARALAELESERKDRSSLLAQVENGRRELESLRAETMRERKERDKLRMQMETQKKDTELLQGTVNRERKEADSLRLEVDTHKKAAEAIRVLMERERKEREQERAESARVYKVGSEEHDRLEREVATLRAQLDSLSKELLKVKSREKCTETPISVIGKFLALPTTFDIVAPTITKKKLSWDNILIPPVLTEGVYTLRLRIIKMTSHMYFGITSATAGIPPSNKGFDSAGFGMGYCCYWFAFVIVC